MRLNKYLYIFNLEWKIYFWFGFQSCINIIIIDGGANDRIQSLDGAVGCRLSSLTLELFLRPHWCRRSKTEYCSITVVVTARWGFCSYKKKLLLFHFVPFFFFNKGASPIMTWKKDVLSLPCDVIITSAPRPPSPLLHIKCFTIITSSHPAIILLIKLRQRRAISLSLPLSPPFSSQTFY